MLKTIPLLLLLASPALAHDATEVPDEARKAWALKRAYELNGNSMVRPLGLGSIDLSKEAPADAVDPNEVNAIDAAASKPSSTRNRKKRHD